MSRTGVAVLVGRQARRSAPGIAVMFGAISHEVETLPAIRTQVASAKHSPCLSLCMKV